MVAGRSFNLPRRFTDNANYDVEILPPNPKGPTMPQSLANVLIHIVFSTKHRQPFLKDESLRGQLHAYAITVLKSLDSPSLAINSVEDHIHILCNLSRTISIAELVEKLKTSTSKW